MSTYSSNWAPRIPELANSYISNNEVVDVGDNASYFYTPSPALTDVCASADFHSDWNGVSWISLETRRNADGTGLYIASFDNRYSYSLGKDYVAIASGSIPNGGLDTNWHNIMFCSIGTTHSLYLDHVLLNSFSDATYANGYVGFDTANGMHLDNYTITLASSPTPNSQDDCKNGGWRKYSNPSFKNQGQCIKYVNHAG